MDTYCVEYTYDDRVDLRDEVRPAHRAYLRELLGRGELLASGPYTGPLTELPGTPSGASPAGALLLLRTQSLDALTAILDADPFWEHGLVIRRSARRWDPVLGPWAG